MDLTPDRFDIVCPQADEDGFHCPGANEFGACELYTNYAVRAKARKGCAFRRLRAPTTLKNVKKARVGQQKQDKRKRKAGENGTI